MSQPPAGMEPSGRDPEDLPEPPALRRLRLLVSTLMVALIVGILSVAAVLVIRLGGLSPTAPKLIPITAERFALPAGAEVQGLGRAGGEVLILLRLADGRERLHAYDAESGALLSNSAIERD
ncbi:MAG: DUF6476 family protein [Pseudomonadota bacterium]